MENAINNNIQLQNEGDIFQYIEIEDEIFGFNYEHNANENTTSFIYNKNKVTSKASFALFRLFVLYVIFKLEDKPLTPFLHKLVLFLLIHECLALANLLAMRAYIFISRWLFNPLIRFPSIFLLFNSFNNMIFFTWFSYGNISILTDRKGVEESLKHNLLMTYYITILLLLGFFIFAKFIFYIIFFVSFCPCITYVMYTDIRDDIERRERQKRVEETMKAVYYEDYIKEFGKENDICVICNDSFKAKDKVICLPCSEKHVFHEDCIKNWIRRKTICPICRADLVREDEYINI